MDSHDAMRALADVAGISQREISRRMGRTDNYLGTQLSRGIRPGTDVLAEVAGACGYMLALVPRAETLPSGSIIIGAD